MTNNRLLQTIAYLAGPIDRISDRGVQWRLDMSLFLRGIGIGVIDPCDKPILGAVSEQDDFVKQRHSIKVAGNYHILHEIMQEIVATDLRSIDLAGFIILHVDTSVHMCGSYNEQTHASLQRKPVLVHCATGMSDIPDWLYGICDHNEFFSSWEDMQSYIKDVAFKPSFPTTKRWKFFDYRKIYGN